MKEKLLLFMLLVVTTSAIVYGVFTPTETPPTKIGVLMVGESRMEKYDGLKQGLLDIGFKDEELHFIVKNAHEDIERLPILIDGLIKEKPDIIVTLGGVETVQIKEEIEGRNINIPVVFAGVAAPKEVGLIDDFFRPGGLFTGINNHHTSISAKRLELLTELVPTTKRVFTVYDETVELSRFSLDEAEAAAKKLSIEVIPINISDEFYEQKIKENHRDGDALLILPGYKIEALTDELVKITRGCKLPAMALYKHEVEAGFLAGHGASFYEQGNQAARYVSSIIQGNSPSEMPVELPDEIRFMINKEVSDELGVVLDKKWLVQAEVVPRKTISEEEREHK